VTALVVAAHPDDEVLGCGGTIARLAAAGEDVVVAILGEGMTSRRGADAPVGDDVDRLHAVSTAVGELLGAREVITHRLPDNRFDSVALLDIVHVVEDVVERVQPTVVYCQHGGDLNVDHQLVYRAVLAATRPQPGHPTREVLSFEVASSTEWAFGRLAPVFEPNVFVDVSAHLDRKLEAMAMYETELRRYPHPRSLEALRHAARRWGAVVGVEAAEAFQLVRSVR